MGRVRGINKYPGLNLSQPHNKGYQTANQVNTIVNNKGYQTANQVDTIVTNKGYQTASQVNTTINGKGYQTANQVDNIVTSKGYQTSSDVQTTISNISAMQLNALDMDTTTDQKTLICLMTQPPSTSRSTLLGTTKSQNRNDRVDFFWSGDLAICDLAIS